MNTTKSTVKLSLAKEYNQNCYIQYFSAIGQRPLGTIQELKKNPDTLDIPTLIGSELQDLPSDTPHFLLNMSRASTRIWYQRRYLRHIWLRRLLPIHQTV